ncbi:hypothetical protein RN001_003440 [Aquatica leii]|uniref:DDE Tnp4 domain-containing protein n=1 Tax=Aquatica leii TaxID=1421715 RepID=A0AAN7PIB2_9COLE|nr:hypothetical protein RN001_003440 [Aquatica leii]
MDNLQFNNLLSLISDKIKKQDTNMRQSISPQKRLAITLCFLATGDTLWSLMYATRVDETTISKFVPEVCTAIYNVGVNGRISDGGVYKESTLYDAVERNALSFPPDSALPSRNKLIKYTFVADEAFSLTTRLMKPYSQKDLTLNKRIFNYRLSRARRVVENAFGILSNRFRILLSPINLNPDKVELLTLTCCVLHNYLIQIQPYAKTTASDNYENDLKGLQTQQRGNRVSKAALEMRE